MGLWQYEYGVRCMFGAHRHTHTHSNCHLSSSFRSMEVKLFENRCWPPVTTARIQSHEQRKCMQSQANFMPLYIKIICKYTKTTLVIRYINIVQYILLLLLLLPLLPLSVQSVFVVLVLWVLLLLLRQLLAVVYQIVKFSHSFYSEMVTCLVFIAHINRLVRPMLAESSAA